MIGWYLDVVVVDVVVVGVLGGFGFYIDVVYDFDVWGVGWDDEQ